MDIAILGAGAVGSYYGAALARAGHRVRFWARGATLEALRHGVLEVRAPEETFNVKVLAFDTASELGQVELALVTVKSYSLPEVADVARTAAGRGAVLLPLLNGVDAADQLAALQVPRSSLLGGVTMISAVRVAPGVVERKGGPPSIILGELKGGTSPRAHAIVEVLRSANVHARESTQMEVDIWQKFVLISTMATTCGLSRASVGAVRSVAQGSEFIEAAVLEAVAVARARGVRLPEDQVVRTLATIHALDPQMRPSFLVDLERGGPTELDALMGAVSRMGRELGIKTPVHSAATAALSASLATPPPV